MEKTTGWTRSPARSCSAVRGAGMVPGGIRLRSQAHDVSWNHHNWVNRMQEYLQARCPIATPQHLWWDQNEGTQPPPSRWLGAVPLHAAAVS